MLNLVRWRRRFEVKPCIVDQIAIVRVAWGSDADLVQKRTFFFLARRNAGAPMRVEPVERRSVRRSEELTGITLQHPHVSPCGEQDSGSPGHAARELDCRDL